MNLKLAYSTCPNDTFMFDALVNRRIPFSGHAFDLQLADIQELNQLALSGEVDICKTSVAAYPRLADRYQVLCLGAAMGKGNGPLLISKKKVYPDEVSYLKIAVPGELTTANQLLSLIYPEATNKIYRLFSDIEEVVLEGEADAGVIIHETRFTYQLKGLKKIADLGQEWENRTKLPIPLGCIVVKKDLPLEVKLELYELVGESVIYALENPDISLPYSRAHAQEMSDDVMQQHIKLYVNTYSVNMGNEGIEAFMKMIEPGMEGKKLSQEEIFIGR
jgi:1,4-dihydroxy-6-naphthoate synthase